jgi:hypothetical protein
MTPRVFLSAGVPHGDRAKAYEPYLAAAIMDAVLDVARVLLRRRARIVCGAQPAISPVLLKTAPEASDGLSVEIFQSKRYRGEVPQTTLDLEQEGRGRIRWIEGTRDEPKPVSLTRMRHAMLAGQMDAGVFIGGMDGVEEEFSLFRDRHSAAPVFVLAGPGGAARRLAETPDVHAWAGGSYLVYAMEIADALGLEEPSGA